MIRDPWARSMPLYPAGGSALIAMSGEDALDPLYSGFARTLLREAEVRYGPYTPYVTGAIIGFVFWNIFIGSLVLK